MSGQTAASLDGLLPGHPVEPWRYLVDTLRLGSDDWAALVGAGMSAGAGLPTWNGLAAGALSLSGSTMPVGVAGRNLPILMQQCESDSGAKFWQFVQGKVCRDDVSPTRAQSLLCTLPFELFATLNYDRLLEAPWASATGLSESHVMAFPELEPAKLCARRLVYLHGRCPGAGKKMDGQSAVLTEGSYLDAYGASTPLTTALNALFMSMNVLILGSSLTDPDLGHILNELGRSNHLRNIQGRRRWFALMPTEEEKYVPGLEYSFNGLALGIEPIYYHSPSPADHSNLDRVLESLGRSVA